MQAIEYYQFTLPNEAVKVFRLNKLRIVKIRGKSLPEIQIAASKQRQKEQGFRMKNENQVNNISNASRASGFCESAKNQL